MKYPVADFVLQTTISDLIQIAPQDFSKFSAVAIEDNINEKYANKVSESGLKPLLPTYD